MTPEQIKELENRTWKRPAPYSDEWFKEATEYEQKRVNVLEGLRKGDLCRTVDGSFVFQDDLDAHRTLLQQAKDRTLLSVIAQLRGQES